MKIIDTNEWKRKNLYDNFIGYTNPIFSLGTELDVTELVKYCKNRGYSFFVSFMFLMMKSINEVEEFRLRIVDDQVVLYEKVLPNYIVMTNDNVVVTSRSEMYDDFDSFYAKVREDIEKSKMSYERTAFNFSNANDCVYISCLPWRAFSSVTNAYNLADKNQTSIPRITWFKYEEDGNGRDKMGFDVAAHHALIDGKPVCDMMNLLQEKLYDVSRNLR